MVRTQVNTMTISGKRFNTSRKVSLFEVTQRNGQTYALIHALRG